MAAECEIDSCGVIAGARCLTCNKAFCLSHGGSHQLGASPRTCLDCDRNSRQHDAEVRNAKIAAEVAAPARIAALATALIDAEVPQVSPRFKQLRKPVGLRRRIEVVDGPELDPVLEIGKWVWKQHEHGWSGTEESYFTEVHRDGRIAPVGRSEDHNIIGLKVSHRMVVAELEEIARANNVVC